jgi:hypothetical protein
MCIVGLKVKLHTFFCSGCFNPRERAFSPYWIMLWLGLRATLEKVTEGKIPALLSYSFYLYNCG